MDIGDVVKKALEDAARELGHVNILIAGRTGVGKSTLINAVYQGRFAATGQGRPVTETTREYTKSGIPLTILDTRGLEMQAFDKTLAELESLIRFRGNQADANRHIHVAWLCISEDSRRIEEAESSLCSMLSRHMPVLGVVTKARADAGFRTQVQQLIPEAANVVRVRAIQEELDDGHTLPPLGLEDLVEATFRLVPEGQQRAFVAAQKVSVQKKKNASHAVVASFSTGAAMIAASPIPFSDALLLVPVQAGMLAGISATFGLSTSAAFITTLIAAAAGGTASTIAGRVLVSNLLKLVPGGGSLAGGAISAATAVALTAALGEAYIVTLAQLFTESGGEPPSENQVAVAFRSRLSAGRNS